MKAYTINIAAIRELAQRYDHQSLASCEQQAINGQLNPCYDAGLPEETINVIAKAGFIRQQLDMGQTLNKAVRELARRMRALQGLE